MLIPNTFNVEAEADILVDIHSEQALIEALRMYPNPFVLGGGSNMLITQKISQPVLHMLLKGIEVQEETDDYVWIKAAAGENWHQFVQYTLSKGYGGLENLSLIYGNVGTTPVQNIGAYGVEIKDVMTSCEAIDVRTLQKRVFSNADCCFGYRESIFKGEEKGHYIITAVTFKLTKRNHLLHTQYGAIEEVLRERHITTPTPQQLSEVVIDIRQRKLPNPAEVGNCGSFFKNPVIQASAYETLKKSYPEIHGYTAQDGIKISAAWLIENTGWKGKQIGNVATHKQQALVIINATGNATGQEIYDFSEEIINSVKEKFGIVLEREVNII